MTILFAGFIGFHHAFEADHLIAVSNLVTERQRTQLAVKDGIFWGLGHTSTILLIASIIMLSNMQQTLQSFEFLEAGVGLMLVGMGGYRLMKYFQSNSRGRELSGEDKSEGHLLAYSVGLVHGLAGSGTIILLAMSTIPVKMLSFLYLLVFGLGSVVGMLLAAGIMSLPLAKGLKVYFPWQGIMMVASSILCILYGFWLIGTSF